MILFLPLQLVGGQNPTNELLWNQEAIQITNEMTAQGNTQLATAWKAFYPAFHTKNPAYNPEQVLSAFTAEELSGGLASGISQTGSVVGNTATAAAKAGEKATYSDPLDYLQNIGDFFNRLTQPQTYVRIAEGLVGILLVYVAIKAVVTPGGVPVASRKAGSTFKDAGKHILEIMAL
jgi:hypothetical protein